MFRPIVACSHPVTLVGGGEVTPEGVTKALSRAPNLVAADGGATVCIEAGHVPEAVIGDFDSIDAATRAAVPADRMHHLASQDDTDFDKALKRIDAPAILGLGFLGGRLDHQLAAFSSLLRDRRPIVLINDIELVFVAPSSVDLRLTPGEPIGLYPLVETVLTTRGLKYPLTDAVVAPDGLISTSNTIVVPDVRIETDRPGVLVIMPLAALEPVLAALWSSFPAR